MFKIQNKKNKFKIVLGRGFKTSGDELSSYFLFQMNLMSCVYQYGTMLGKPPEFE